MRIGIIACDIFQKEIDQLVEGDTCIVHKEYLEFALHENPDILKNKVLEKVESMSGKVDAVFLGYGICQSLKGITDQLSVPSVMLDADDCIAAFLTPEEYQREKQICPGTWFNSPRWAELGIEGAIKELHLDCLIEKGYDPMYFLKMMYNGYERCLFIDTGVPDREKWLMMSKHFADTLELRHECRACSLEMLEEGLAETKRLAMKIKGNNGAI